MKQIDLYNIKLSNIQIFLTAAEYSNFTIAAEKLHMTQPMVSKTIQAIEQEQGIILFVRTHGRLQITPAGRALYHDWKNILGYFEQSIENAHSIQEGQVGRLRIGNGDLGGRNQKLFDAVTKVRTAIPGLFFDYEYHDMSVLLDRLMKNDLDLIILSGHLLAEVQNLQLKWKIMCSSTLAVFVPVDNPLSKRETLTFKDLRHEKFICFSTEGDSSYMALLAKLGAENGFFPQISCYVPNGQSMKANLLLGNGIALADSVTDLEDAGIRKYDLVDYPNNIIAVWKEDNCRKGLADLLALL